MRPLVGPVPEPAERTLSALRRSARATLTPGDPARDGLSRDGRSRGGRSRDGAAVAVPLVHAIPGTAELCLVVPAAVAREVAAREAGAGEGRAPARLEVLDVIVGGAADGRCRRVVVVEGRISVPSTPEQRRVASDIARELADPALLDVGTAAALVRLVPERIVLTDHDGVTAIDPDDLATSGPDPFADLEGLWLAHLGDPRCPVVERIAARLARCVPAERPLLVGLDRAGVDLEVTGPDGAVRRHRLAFAQTCVGVADLGMQIRLLAGCPRSAAPLAGRASRPAGRDGRADRPARDSAPGPASAPER